MSTSPTDKGQASLEFMTMTVLLLLVFAGVYDALATQEIQAAESQVQLQAAATADRVAYELDLALAEGDGFYRTVQLPQEIGSTPYNISVANGSVRLAWEGSTVFARTAAVGIIGSIRPGTNTVRNNGSVVITQ